MAGCVHWKISYLHSHRYGFLWFSAGCIIYVSLADETQPVWAARGSSGWVFPIFNSFVFIFENLELKQEPTEVERYRVDLSNRKKWKEKEIQRQSGWVSKPHFPPHYVYFTPSLFLAISTEV